MSYDIGIGTCIAFDGATVTVRLDRAMVPRLVPAHRWVRTHVQASLRLRREQCSHRRAIEVGAEVCIDSAHGDTIGEAMLELGDERYLVDLGTLIRDTAPTLAAPQPLPPPQPWQRPYPYGARSQGVSRFR